MDIQKEEESKVAKSSVKSVQSAVPKSKGYSVNDIMSLDKMKLDKKKAVDPVGITKAISKNKGGQGNKKAWKSQKSMRF